MKMKLKLTEVEKEKMRCIARILEKNHAIKSFLKSQNLVVNQQFKLKYENDDEYYFDDDYYLIAGNVNEGGFYAPNNILVDLLSGEQIIVIVKKEIGKV